MSTAIQDRIRALLSLANNNANINEANTAMALACQLAEKHRLDIATIEIRTGVAEEKPTKDGEAILSGGRIRTWKCILLSTILKNQGCSCYSSRNATSHEGVTSYYAYGRPSDLLIAREMFSWAMTEIEFVGVLFCKGKGKVYANSWYTGAVDGIREALKSGQNKAREGVCTTALALVDKRASEARAAMYAENNLRSKTFSRTSMNASAYNAGREVGSKMNLGSIGKMLSK
jgi:hypothetical protein